jgi:hypothetical protein
VTTSATLDLTDAQRRFAEAYGAQPGMEASNRPGVFFYRQEDDRLYRWLVDPDGNIRETDSFR